MTLVVSNSSEFEWQVSKIISANYVKYYREHAKREFERPEGLKKREPKRFIPSKQFKKRAKKSALRRVRKEKSPKYDSS